MIKLNRWKASLRGRRVFKDGADNAHRIGLARTRALESRL
jgi:hypothetical protein